VFVPGMCAPIDVDPLPEDASRVITVLTCNVQDCQSYPDKLLDEFQRIDPDVLMLQEVGICEQIGARYTGYHIIDRGEYWIVSRYPVRQVGELRTPSPFGNRGRLTATLFEIDHPSGTFQVVNVHCHTARWGIRELKWHSPFTADGVDAFDNFQLIRETELAGLVEYCEMAADRMPTLFAGDFNTPSSSNMFAPLRDAYRSAYESAGWGYGYTSPCNTASRWPNNTPWLRIDHILMTEEWALHSAAIGHTNGSDHRLMWAEVSLQD
jgi:endonuclease/exonuclease/phosphatase family metal-dependent hydrolase